LVEDRALGTQLIQELKAEGMYFAKPYLPPSGVDKVMRLHAQTALFESGNVLFPKSAHWLPEYLRGLARFPGSKFDDQVDSTTQALEYFTSVLRKLTIYDVL
jgi:predicted phage terminase large subunit-like protein